MDLEVGEKMLEDLNEARFAAVRYFKGEPPMTPEGCCDDLYIDAVDFVTPLPHPLTARKLGGDWLINPNWHCKD